MGRTKSFEKLEPLILDNSNSKGVSGEKTEKTTEEKEQDEEEVRAEKMEKTTEEGEELNSANS